MGVEGFESVLSELAATLGGVDGLACELLELLHGHHNGLAVPVYGQQIAGAVCRNMDTVAPIPLAGGQE